MCSVGEMLVARTKDGGAGHALPALVDRTLALVRPDRSGSARSTTPGYWKERSVIRREDDVDGRASVTKDEERVLRGG